MIKFTAALRKIVKYGSHSVIPTSQTTMFAFAGRKGKTVEFLSPQKQQQRNIWNNFVVKIDDLITKHQHAEGEQLIENYLDERFFQKQQTLQDPEKVIQYLGTLNLKVLRFITQSTLEIISRKFDKVLTNIDNQLNLLHEFQLGSKQSDQHIITLYNQYILILILHNHDRLRSFLIEDLTKIQKKSQKKQKVGYQKKLKSVYIHSNLPIAKYTKALAFAILGQYRMALSLLIELLNLNRKNSQYFSLFITLIVYRGNGRYEQNKQKYNSQKVKLFILNMLLQKKKIKFEQIPTAISPQDSQWMINSVLGFLLNQNIQWDDLDSKKLDHFFKPLYLIAENYYLSGEVQSSKRIINKLKSIKPNKQSMKMLYKFISSMYLYDQQKYKQCIQSIDLKQMNDLKSIFQIHNLVNDTLRKNIFMIASKSYQKLKQVDNSQEMELVADMYQSINDLYTVNQLSQDQETQKQKQNGIAPYYLNIELKEAFGF